MKSEQRKVNFTVKSDGLITIILAAGKGTRMKSKLPKVLHCAGGKPMVKHVLDAAKEAGSTHNIVVVGFGHEQVQQALAGQAEIVLQEEQLGTGHAVMQAQPLIKDYDASVMVLCGDTPLVTGSMLKNSTPNMYLPARKLPCSRRLCRTRSVTAVSFAAKTALSKNR